MTLAQTPPANSSQTEVPQPTSHWPKAGASGVVLRDRHVLLVERGKGAAKGMWSFPGGHIEPGERAAVAAQREVQEETGVIMQLHGLLDMQDVIIRDTSGQLTAHYVLAVYWGTTTDLLARASSDAADARFVPLDELAGYHLTQGASRLLKRAVAERDRQR
jgi:8-oxo-dGTP diphosphatase